MAVVGKLGCPPRCPAPDVADALLRAALVLDEGRPVDDVTIVVVQIIDRSETEGPEIRRMTVSLPISPF
jgi:hypothetical protein